MRHIFLFLFLVTSIFANLVLHDDTKVYDDFSISYFHDVNNSLDIEDITDIKFRDKVSNQYTLGYQNGTFWFKLILDNQSNKNNFTLYFKKLYADEFTIYEKIDGAYKKQAMGLKTFKNRSDFLDSDPIYNFEIQSGAEKILYIKMQSKLGILGTIQIVSDYKEIEKQRRTELLLYMFYFGGLVMALLLNISLFFSLKEKIYAYYVAYIVSFGVFVLLFSGLIIDLGFYSWYYQLHAPIALVLVFLILFSNALLDIKIHLPKIYKFLLLLNVLFLLLFVLIFLDFEPWFQIMSGLTTVVFLTLLYAALKISLLGLKKAQYYLVLMIANVFALGLMTAVFNGDVPYTDINMYLFLYVSFLEMGFFSLILANKINEFKSETIEIQNQLIEEKNINALELEEKVKERTRDLELLQKQLSIQANRDPLTELYNRRYFSAIAKKNFNLARRYKKKLSVLMIDIDFFKKINDTHGHAIGDDVLVAVTSKLRALARESDIVARYGGEEFVFLLPETSSEEACVLAQRICDEVKIAGIFKDIDINLTVSVGVSELLEEDKDIEALISRADKKLYEAKENGRDRVCF